MSKHNAKQHALRVIRPALLLSSSNFINDLNFRLSTAGIQNAVARRDAVPLFNWVISLLSLQGISDKIAFDYDVAHGGIAFREVAASLGARPTCPRLRSYWAFDGCSYRKSAMTCAEPDHISKCPVPRHSLRKGSLNVAAYALFLFLRDACRGDVVGWVDERLGAVDPGQSDANRTAVMRAAVLEPLTNIAGTGSKLWAMILADLLVAGDPNRERWVTTGASMTAIDSLVHAFLHRSGTLSRFEADHPYGVACYQPGGCADIIELLAREIDAREFGVGNPRYFPRFIQHALWKFCAQSGWDICHGNRIDDVRACQQTMCPSYDICDHVPLKPA